ncbi:allantoin permease [Ktedonobacter sp. SOSP1-85]|uniref:purine-cytosine permease family protein n=1 Tax=Ktedonobacter sp. SOSP1-85 TaxID=2778367 RepID=UPI001915544B|nr:cytosine permease [Ktedonobacter sp. SOSP1-85]GHO79020.1 allantoin permease [Ktedonobacter sp. SOSP1-85]
MSNTVQQPESDQVWSIEVNGINPIDQEQRHGKPSELFWIWCASNISILGIVYGAGYLTGNGLNLWQSLIVGLIATAVSFLFVGILSISGVLGGAPMLTLSRATFGTRGNIGPTLVSWISLVGWETLLVIASAGALTELLTIFGISVNPVWTVVSIIVLSAAVVACGYWGHATLVWMQRAATWIFGILTIIIIAFIVPQTNWGRLLSQPPGPWDTGVVTAFVIVMAATGIGWINSGADYARYLPRKSSGSAITLWTMLGGTLPLYILMVVGVLLASFKTEASTSAGSLETIRETLPVWLAVPYLLTAVGGLLAGAALDIYSSGLNLLAMGIRVKRQYAVLIDGVVMIAGSIAVTFFSTFSNALYSFLLLLAAGLTTWAAIFLIDMIWRRSYDLKSLSDTSRESAYYYTFGFNIPACVAWLIGVVIGLLFTASSFFTGPLAKGIFASTSLGYLFGASVSAILYLVLRPLFVAQKMAGENVQEEPTGISS